mmetsp:Transcript_26175/g.26416  ORF Transcript_26175/g.26416 Transcript_26175/m.26416 type:complete len:114 (+) Transcript_26175:224-565(+)|eukprot:CAMPEP_0182427850 /NCGR_PEP_ID=MMETSP1167-20130531/20280_1 /TAXON_ID=2988 /ORGANISM="Mallomonas Sp, Strain CCMP3275" /LENGTH=113 /DNA_ID=CAMNT_0024610393 /DNA_START=198 /DNA_END=539 /DNA_ORIENTATION=+
MAIEPTNIIYIAVSVGIISGFFIFAMYFYICRLRRLANEFRYESVRHELDEEEIEFKRSIEMQADDFDDMFNMSGNDLEFDSQDKDRLRMLDKYRNNLVAGVDADNDETDRNI